MRFTGHERDFDKEAPRNTSSYIDHMHARAYVPEALRFLSPDPLLGNLLQPQSLNRYAYVLNNPTNYIDPTGMQSAGSYSAGFTVEALSPETVEFLKRFEKDQAALWLSFLKSLSGYNYGKGAFTYFRGIYRGQRYANRRDGYLGPEEQAAAHAEAKRLKQIYAQLQKCMQDAQWRADLQSVAIRVNGAIPSHVRNDMTQVAAGRVVTGLGVSYALSRIGLAPMGPIMTFSAAEGDIRHYAEEAHPSVEAIFGLLHALSTGGH